MFAKGGLKYMFSMINALQIIFHFPIFTLGFPAPVMSFIKTIFPLVMFDVIETFENLSEIFNDAIHLQDAKMDEINMID